MGFDLKIHPHRRFDPLRGEWVLVSPQRMKRPWQGQIEKPPEERAPAYDPQCYLCPGNARAGGARNPQYSGTFVFDNDFAALEPDTPSGEFREGALLLAESEKGRCRVVCFSPRHDLTLARMPPAEIQAVVDTWAEQFAALSGQAEVRAVHIFENRGAIMGSSNAHPHGQIWANETIPDELAREIASSSAYRQQHGSGLLENYLASELQKQERIVVANEHFAAVVPFWAVWPFETLLASRRRVCCLAELDKDERRALAGILHQLTIRYDNLFRAPFPYTMGFHQLAPGSPAAGAFHLHAHFYPPLLRSATVKKFMVGYEMLAMPQRDITPEAAADLLKHLPNIHYLDAR
jgi:UDPglucose--hexose-1-phosphate uridylyltransferase